MLTLELVLMDSPYPTPTLPPQWLTPGSWKKYVVQEHELCPGERVGTVSCCLFIHPFIHSFIQAVNHFFHLMETAPGQALEWLKKSQEPSSPFTGLWTQRPFLEEAWCEVPQCGGEPRAGALPLAT